MKSSFVVYRRVGDKVVPYSATLVRRSKGWANGQPVGVSVGIQVGAEIPWPELYGGHTQWIAEQVDKVRQAIKTERARRAARKQTGASQSGTQAATSKVA